MKKTSVIYQKISLIITIMAVLSACANQQGTGLIVDEQGFATVKHSSFDYLKVRPEVVFKHYKKLKIEPLTISYAERSQLSPPYNKKEDYQFDDREIARFNQQFIKAFSQQWKKSLGWQLTEQSGPDVVVLKAVISDLYLYASIKNNKPMSYQAVVNESSKMMIQVMLLDAEGVLLLDSQGDKVTGRQGSGTNTMTQMNSVRYWSDAYQAFRQWANLLQRQMAVDNE